MFVRISGDMGELAESLRGEAQAVDPDPPVFGARTMETVVCQVFAKRRFQLQMIAAFAAAALLLAALGMDGVTASPVSQRTQEIGIGLTLWGLLAGLAEAFP